MGLTLRSMFLSIDHVYLAVSSREPCPQVEAPPLGFPMDPSAGQGMAVYAELYTPLSVQAGI